MSDSGEQNYGERVRAGGRGRLRSPLVLSPGLAGLCGRAAGVWRRAGAGAPEGLMDARPESPGRPPAGRGPRTRRDRFFFFLPLGGGGWGRSKMAAAFPRRWGMGAESNFAVALLRSRAAAILGSRAGRAARSTKWRSRRGSWRPGPAASPVLQGKVRRSHVGLGVGRVHGWRRAGLSGASGHGNGARGGVGGPDGFVLGRFLRGRGLNWSRTQGH